MDTSAAISKFKKIQAALSVISVLNINAPVFPRDYKVSNGSIFDYVIIGGGIGGSVVTGRLVEAGYSVLLLEAGGLANIESNFPGLSSYVKNSSVDWKYSTEADKKCDRCRRAYSSLVTPKVLGGASVTAYMVYNKGNPLNYDKWAKSTKDNSWNWENMQKYFKKGERLRDPEILNSPYKRFHGTNGKLNVTRDTNDVCDEYIEGFRKAGQPTPLDNIGNASLGYSRGLYFIYNGIRNNAAFAYMNSIKDSPKIHVSLHSLATKILFDDKNNAVGVEFIKCGKKITVKAKKEVIVSAGPFKSPQLLMLSGIGPEKELKKWNINCVSDLPVGQNLQNIESVVLTFKTKKESEAKGVDVHKPIPLVIGYATTNESCKYPDYNTLNFILRDSRSLLALCSLSWTLKNEICDKLYRKAANTQLLTSLLIDFDIKDRGEITLKSADPYDPPKIKAAHYSNNKDLDSLVKKIQHFMKVVSTSHFKGMGLEFMDPISKCGQHKKGSNEYWKCYALCMTGVPRYFVGSNSMGAVVDNKFCVKGTKNLRVVDVSVIPNIISGFTQAVIVALAEKAAEIILTLKY